MMRTSDRTATKIATTSIDLRNSTGWKAAKNRSAKLKKNQNVKWNRWTYETLLQMQTRKIGRSVTVRQTYCVGSPRVQTCSERSRYKLFQNTFSLRKLNCTRAYVSHFIRFTELPILPSRQQLIDNVRITTHFLRLSCVCKKRMAR